MWGCNWPAYTCTWRILALLVVLSLKEAHGFDFAEELANSTLPVIVVPENHSVAGDFAPYLQKPLKLNRNVTVTGAQGVSTILDLQFLHGVVSLCPTCTFKFENITIANERRGNNSPIDFFVGQPAGTSIIKLHNVHRLRLACASGPDSATVVDVTPRSKVLPNATKPQVFNVSDYEWSGRVYPRTLSTEDYTADIPYQIQEGRNSEGGYALVAVNMHRLCLNTVSDSCLAVKATEVCVDDLIDQLLAGEHASAGLASRRPPTASIVAPIVVVCAAVAAVIVGFLWMRRRRAQQQQQNVAGVAKQSDGANPYTSKTGISLSTAEQNSSSDLDIEKGIRCSRVVVPGPPRKGWSTTASLICPSIGEVKDATIQLGELLGAGSYGRVYKSRWDNRDVAVKIIEHDTSTVQQVENEVHLMMSVQHENIVKAYCFVTYTQHSSAAEGSIVEGSSSTGTARVRARLRFSMDGRGSADGRSLHTTGGSQHNTQLSLPALASADAATLDTSGSAMSRASSILPPHGAMLVASCLGPSPAAATATAAGGASTPQHQAGPVQLQQSLDSCDPTDQVAAAAAVSSLVVRSVDCSPRHSFQGCGTSQVSTGTSAMLNSTDDRTSMESSSCVLTPGTWGEDQEDVLHRTSHGTTCCKAETHLVMEYCNCGTLGKLVAALRLQQQQEHTHQMQEMQMNLLQEDQQQQQQQLQQADREALLLQVLPLLRDVASGLQLLHSLNIVHADLNTRNVLVSSNSSVPGGLTAKLADFGLSRTIKQHKTHRTTKACGTISHMPPEVLKEGRISPAVDMYAFAIMMWETYTGAAAFKKLHYGGFYQAVVINNLRPTVPDDMPADFRLLMEQCWAAEAAARPTAQQAMEALTGMIAMRRADGTA